ncbi:hypothetical protein DdX_04182 [Ditylenchus destructor]|uniref:F-box domain-containing protein n=1 Tax=Ditylenchus destructor TaxID=166010 RepID=A0AAD4R4B0_9BILA|nr:hypothetical protein DdX_04182 [Ditylenchus destructor]
MIPPDYVIAEPLFTDLVRTVLNFLDRRQLLHLSAISHRCCYLIEYEFDDAETPYFILDCLCGESQRKLNAAVVYSRVTLANAPLDLWEELATCRFIRFNHIGFSWDYLEANMDSVKSISHLWTDKKLCVSSFDSIELNTSLMQLVLTCRELTLTGISVLIWLPRILANSNLDRIALYDSNNINARNGAIDYLPVREIVKYLFHSANTRKHREFCLYNVLDPEIIDELIGTIEQKFLNSTQPLSFTLKWFMRIQDWWILHMPICHNRQTKQQLCYAGKVSQYVLNRYIVKIWTR